MKYKRAHKVPWRVVDGKAVLVSVPNSEVMVLNDTGTEIWDFLSEGRTLDEIVEHLVTVFECDRGSCSGDAEDFIAEMTKKGAVDAV